MEGSRFVAGDERSTWGWGIEGKGGRSAVFGGIVGDKGDHQGEQESEGDHGREGTMASVRDDKPAGGKKFQKIS